MVWLLGKGRYVYSGACFASRSALRLSAILRVNCYLSEVSAQFFVFELKVLPTSWV